MIFTERLVRRVQGPAGSAPRRSASPAVAAALRALFQAATVAGSIRGKAAATRLGHRGERDAP